MLADSVQLDEPKVSVVFALVALLKIALPVALHPLKLYPELVDIEMLNWVPTGYAEPEDTALPFCVTLIVPPVGFDHERVGVIGTFERV